VKNDAMRLSRRERQIMEVVYARTEAAASEITAAIDDAPSHTAVRTLLGILERKGHLVHRKRGREFIYRATRPRGAVARSALRQLLATFFDNSVERALASYMTDPKTKLSDDDFGRLEQLIAQTRKKA
jgi:BlaI family transcriptional regulator, penicillinase repressor